MRTVAITIKRGTLDEKAGTSDQLCQVVREMITNQNPRTVRFITLMVDEMISVIEWLSVNPCRYGTVLFSLEEFSPFYYVGFSHESKDIFRGESIQRND